MCIPAPEAAESGNTDDTTDNQNEYEVVSSSEACSSQEASKVEEVYDYVPKMSRNDDEYDYESPYWAPADKRTELFRQFKKLRIQSIAQKELE